MFKIHLNSEQINAILKWGKDNFEFVRDCVYHSDYGYLQQLSCDIPCRSCEIITDYGVKLMVRRLPDYPTVYSFRVFDMSTNEKIMGFGYCVATRTVSGFGYVDLPNDENKPFIDLWESLMAYMDKFNMNMEV